jgi:4-azaleucine resistance transporter AzlC
MQTLSAAETPNVGERQGGCKSCPLPERAEERRVDFTRSGFIAGARQTLPLALGVLAVGLVFGVLARQAGLNLPEVVLMSGLVFAGTAQFIALGLWGPSLPVLTIILTTVVVNARHLLMGAALRPWFGSLTTWKTYSSIFFMSDESWALSMRELLAGSDDAAFLPGSGVALWSAWGAGTTAGYLAGRAIHDPAQWGLDFAFVAAFAALLTGMWNGKRDLAPWTVAAGVALGAAYLLPGKWYILLGALAGSIVGAIRDGH